MIHYDKLLKIEVDLVIEDIDDAYDMMVKLNGMDIKYKLLKSFGPAAGWPVWELTGRPTHLRKYLESSGFDKGTTEKLLEEGVVIE